MPFNPFDKPAHELTAGDLTTLIDRRVAEGYFVEFKSELPANAKIGHSIASLANTYGGWYIVGVKTGEHNIAKEICGFDSSTSPDPVARVRDTIRSHISPTPIFQIHVVTLDSGRLVVIVAVPGDQDTPFITLDGRIYRRTHDSSDPVPETDRHAVDRLIDQGQQRQREFDRFSKDDRSFSQLESKYDSPGWAAFYLWPYPIEVVEGTLVSITAAVVEDLLNRSRRPTQIPFRTDEGPFMLGSGNVPFTAGYITHNSIVLRQTESATVALNCLTLELGFEGWARLFIPLRRVVPISATEVSSWVQSREVARILQEYESRDSDAQGLSLVRFVDINNFWATVAILVNYYREWLGEQPVLSHVKVAVSLSNIWRSVAFLDDDLWAAQTDQLGMPILMRDRVAIPPETGGGALIKYDDILWFTLCQLATSALGLSPELFARTIAKAATDASNNSRT